MTDLASLGLAVDLSHIDAASKSLGNFVKSGKDAQISADVLVASAVRLGISIEEVKRRLASANDNLATNADMAMKLADATKQVAAANDNFAKSMAASGAATKQTGVGLFATAENALTLAGHLKLLALGAYALSPAFRGFVNAGISKVLLDIIPASALAQRALAGFVSAGVGLLSILGRIGPPILGAVVAFKAINAVWDKGAALLDKYANSLRSLDLEGTAQSLAKLTKNQGEAGEIISAEQISRATELGVRLQDASFIINRFLNKSIIDFISLSLKLQTVWVVIVETIAKAAAILSTIPIGKIASVVAGVAIGPVAGAVNIAQISSNNLSDGENSASIKSATDRLSAVMGVAALTSEALNKTKMAVGDLDDEFNIGNSFIARYSDNIKKLADGMRDTDSWDRVAKGIGRSTSALIANSESVGQSISFQEQLRVETRLLESTKGGLNAATNDQIAKFAELRTTMSAEQALQEAGIKLDKEKTQTMKDLAKAAGDARQQRAQEAFAISNQNAINSDEIATRSLTAYSAAANGAIVADQVRLQLKRDLTSGAATQEQVDERAASARKLAMDTELKQLSEAARARALAATQTIATTQVSIDAMSKSVGENYRLLTIEQTRQQLQQADPHNVTNQKAELAILTEKINKTSELKQIEAETSAKRTADFDLQTSMMSSLDQQIASVQKNLHGDGWQAFMNDGLAATMRTADAMKQFGSILNNNITTGLADMLDGTKSVGQGFRDMSKSILRAIEEMAIKLLIVGPLMRSLQGVVGGGLGGLAGLMPSPSAMGNIFDGGNIIPFAKGGVIGQPTLSPMALMGEAGPEAVMPLARGPGGKLGVQLNGATSSNVITFGDTTIVVQGNADDNSLKLIRSELAEHRKIIAGEIKKSKSMQRMQSHGVA